MKKTAALTLMTGTLLVVATAAVAQRPKGDVPQSKGAEDFTSRMLKFDSNKDGKVSEEEVTDTRLTRVFNRADTDKDGVLTKAEMTAFAAQEQTKGGFGGPRGFGGPGGQGGRGMMGMGGPPRIGEILPGFFQERLGLDEAQKKKVAELQKEVDEKLNKILSAEQAAQLKEMKERGPGGRGGPGGPPPDREEHD